MILLKGRLWQAHSEPPSAEAQNARTPYTSAIILGERIRPPSPAALLLVKCISNVYRHCGVCVCVPARARGLVRVLMCAYMVCGSACVCHCARLCVYPCLCSLCVCVCLYMCVCECVFVRVQSWEGLSHSFCMGPTWSKSHL